MCSRERGFREVVDAAVISYNSEEDLSGLFRCDPLLAAFDRIVVVDNASADGSSALARGAGADVVTLNHNEGFGTAANVGAGLTTGDAFFLLNPDIRFSSADVPERLMHNLCESWVGIAAPRLVLPDGKFQDSAREVPTPWEIVRRRCTSASFGSISCEDPRDVPWVVGACMVINRKAFDAVGGFDPRYFLYFEDVDLCVRLQRRGWSVRFDPTVEVGHYHRAASHAALHSPATRAHMHSAARFFLHHPRFMAHQFTPHGTVGLDVALPAAVNQIENPV